jgi:hypothetical protein
MPAKAAAEKKPASKAPAKAPVEKKDAGKKTAASGDKKKRTKTRKETYSSYIYKGEFAARPLTHIQLLLNASFGTHCIASPLAHHHNIEPQPHLLFKSRLFLSKSTSY